MLLLIALMLHFKCSIYNNNDKEQIADILKEFQSTNSEVPHYKINNELIANKQFTKFKTKHLSPVCVYKNPGSSSLKRKAEHSQTADVVDSSSHLEKRKRLTKSLEQPEENVSEYMFGDNVKVGNLHGYKQMLCESSCTKLEGSFVYYERQKPNENIISSTQELTIDLNEHNQENANNVDVPNPQNLQSPPTLYSSGICPKIDQFDAEEYYFDDLPHLSSERCCFDLDHINPSFCCLCNCDDGELMDNKCPRTNFGTDTESLECTKDKNRTIDSICNEEINENNLLMDMPSVERDLTSVPVGENRDMTNTSEQIPETSFYVVYSYIPNDMLEIEPVNQTTSTINMNEKSQNGFTSNNRIYCTIKDSKYYKEAEISNLVSEITLESFMARKTQKFKTAIYHDDVSGLQICKGILKSWKKVSVATLTIISKFYEITGDNINLTDHFNNITTIRSFEESLKRLTEMIKVSSFDFSPLSISELNIKKPRSLGHKGFRVLNRKKFSSNISKSVNKFSVMDLLRHLFRRMIDCRNVKVQSLIYFLIYHYPDSQSNHNCGINQYKNLLGDLIALFEHIQLSEEKGAHMELEEIDYELFTILSRFLNPGPGTFEYRKKVLRWKDAIKDTVCVDFQFSYHALLYSILSSSLEIYTLKSLLMTRQNEFYTGRVKCLSTHIRSKFMKSLSTLDKIGGLFLRDYNLTLDEEFSDHTGFDSVTIIKL